MKRIDVGPDLGKRKLREKMSHKEAKTQLEVVMSLIDQQKGLEDGILHINTLLNGIVQAYGCANLNHLLSVLCVRGGGVIPAGMVVKNR